MEYIPNTNIDELRGYLKSLHRLASANYAFGVALYDANCEIDILAAELVRTWSIGDEYSDPGTYEYFGNERIEYSQLCQEQLKYIFNGLLDFKRMDSDDEIRYSKKIILEDINEYYGLLSTSLNEDGAFHPLISGDVFQLDIRNSRYAKSFFYIVKIETYYVLTYFSQFTDEE